MTELVRVFVDDDEFAENPNEFARDNNALMQFAISDKLNELNYKWLTTLKESRSRFNFSIDSLSVVDEFCNRAMAEWPLDTEYEAYVPVVGAYVATVIQQNHRGRWIDNSEPKFEFADISEAVLTAEPWAWARHKFVHRKSIQDSYEETIERLKTFRFRRRRNPLDSRASLVKTVDEFFNALCVTFELQKIADDGKIWSMMNEGSKEARRWLYPDEDEDHWRNRRDDEWVGPFFKGVYREGIRERGIDFDDRGDKRFALDTVSDLFSDLERLCAVGSSKKMGRLFSDVISRVERVNGRRDHVLHQMLVDQLVKIQAIGVVEEIHGEAVRKVVAAGGAKALREVTPISRGSGTGTEWDDDNGDEWQEFNNWPAEHYRHNKFEDMALVSPGAPTLGQPTLAGLARYNLTWLARDLRPLSS